LKRCSQSEKVMCSQYWPAETGDHDTKLLHDSFSHRTDIQTQLHLSCWRDTWKSRWTTSSLFTRANVHLNEPCNELIVNKKSKAIHPKLSKFAHIRVPAHLASSSNVPPDYECLIPSSYGINNHFEIIHLRLYMLGGPEMSKSYLYSPTWNCLLVTSTPKNSLEQTGLVSGFNFDPSWIIQSLCTIKWWLSTISNKVVRHSCSVHSIFTELCVVLMANWFYYVWNMILIWILIAIRNTYDQYWWYYSISYHVVLLHLQFRGFTVGLIIVVLCGETLKCRSSRKMSSSA
jgi:hypothetical protein